MKRGLTIASLILFNAVFAVGQQDDFAEGVDHTIQTLYEVISGPAGERNWARFDSLFHPNATMGATIVQKDGSRIFRSFTPQQYKEQNGPFFLKNGFYETELWREENRFGGIAQVYTAYGFSFEENGLFQQTGINAVQLVYDDRWKIINIVWEAATEANPLPER